MITDLDLLALDDVNDTHWTADGEPALATVQTLVGRKVTREEVRATGVVRGKPQARKPAAVKPVVDHQQEIARAERDFEQKGAARTAARAKMKAKRAALAEAILSWQRLNPPLPPDEAAREHIRRTAAHAAAGNVVVPAERVYRSRLDEVMAGATRKSRDISGSTRPRVRGLSR